MIRTAIAILKAGGKKARLVPRKSDTIGRKNYYSVVLRYPVVYPFLRGTYIRDTSTDFSKFEASIAGKYSKALILGNSPNLNDISQTDVDRLENQSGFLTIGINRSAFRCQTQVLMWSDLRTLDDLVLRRAVKRDDCYVIEAVLNRDHRLAADKDVAFQELHRFWTRHQSLRAWPHPKLYMFRNTLVPALHLCLRAGIKEINLVGFGFDDRRYFYRKKSSIKRSGYELRSPEAINALNGGYTTTRIVGEVLKYLAYVENVTIRYYGESSFLSELNFLEKINYIDDIQ